MAENDPGELTRFLTGWNNNECPVKPIFDAIFKYLSELDNVELHYKRRPGISHSLRARHTAQKRSVFVLVDIIDDTPETRWISVCFYADLVSDPEKRGDLNPGGLMGEDALCFDIDAPEEKEREYILDRLREAQAGAARESER